MHVQTKLVEEFKDQHGFLGLYACSLSNTLLSYGNRVFPYTPAEARSALAQHTNSFGVTTEEAKELEEEHLPITSRYFMALSKKTTPLQRGSAQKNQLCSF